MAMLRSAEDYLKADIAHVIHGGGIPGQVTGTLIAEAEGIMVRDFAGKEYIDGLSGAICVNLGHGRRELAEAAMNQIRKLDFASTFAGNTHTVVVECAQRLADITPEGLKHFFFCCSGSEATEINLKMARLYWRSKGMNKYKIIALYYGYHGSTYGSASAGGIAARWKDFDPLLPGFIHIPRYYCYHCAFGLTYPSCQLRCAHYLEETIQKEGPDSVAAFIAEPAQGAGGMIPPPPEYWPIIRDICTRNNVLLIADEVITGFGRTGKLFAMEHWGVKPDLMTLAKGITSAYIPLGVAVLSEGVYQGLKAAGAPIMHSVTYSGHPVACAVATKAMEILVEERLTENAAQVGKYMATRLQKLEGLPHVAAATSIGLMGGFELVADKATKKPFDPALKVPDKVVAGFRERGLLTFPFGDRICLGPPLITTLQQMERIFDIVEPVVASVTAEAAKGKRG